MDVSTQNLKKNLLYNTIGNIIYFICQWLITGLFVKTLAPEGEGVLNGGILATAATASNMFLTFASFGMRNFQVSDAGKYSDRTYIRSRYLTVAVSIFLCLAYSLVIGYRGTQLTAVLIWLVYKLVEAITDVYHGCAQKQGRMDVIGISYAVRGIMTVVLFSAGMLLTKDLIISLLLITAFSYLFSGYFDLFRNRVFITEERTKTSWKGVYALLLECLPLALYSFLSTTSASVPRTILERLCGTEQIGIFNFVNSPVLIIQVGIAYIFSPFIGVFAEKLRAGDKSGFRSLALKLTVATMALGVVGVGGVLVLGRWGLTFLYGSEMAEYAFLLVPMVITTILTCISLFYCMLLTVMRDMKGLIIANAIGIVASIISSFLFIPRYVLIGTSYAAIAALLVQCVSLAVFGLKDLQHSS